MKRKQFLLTLLLAVISAFLGGMFGVWFLMPPSVLAQSTNQDVTAGKITARSITVVDESGNERISIIPGAISMEDPQRNLRFQVGETDKGVMLFLAPRDGERQGINMSVADAASMFGPQPVMYVDDVNGKTVWSAP